MFFWREKDEEEEEGTAERKKQNKNRNSPQKKKTSTKNQNSCGADPLGRPVIYSVLSLARGSRDVSSNTQHMTSVFEGAIRMMEHQRLKGIGGGNRGSSSASLAGSEEKSNNDNGSGSGGASPSSPSAPPSPVPSASSSYEGNNSEAALVAEQWIWVSDMHGFVSFSFFQLFFFPSTFFL